MTPTDWEFVRSAAPMLDCLRRAAGTSRSEAWERPLRLFAVAACRLVWGELNETCRDAVLAAEAFTEGRLGGQALVDAGTRAARFLPGEPPAGEGWESRRLAWMACTWAGSHIDGFSAHCPGGLWDGLAARLPDDALPSLLRDIFPCPEADRGGPRRWPGAGGTGPFPALAVDLAVAAYGKRIPCRKCGGRGVVRQGGIYASRHDTEACGACGMAGALEGGRLDPLRLSVLADCLEEAGADAVLVAHLRGPGRHVRGCWAVDAVLGRLR